MTYLTILISSLLSIPFLAISVMSRAVVALMDGLLTTFIKLVVPVIIGVVILVILSLLGGAVGMGIDEGLEAAALLLFLFFALILVNGIMAAFLGYLFWKISIPIYIYLLTIVRTICDMLGNKSLNIYNSLLNRIMRRIQRI